MAPCAPRPVLRFESSCPDLGSYRERYEPAYAERGIFVPSDRPFSHPVGTRVHLRIELGDGTVGYAGGAIVVEHVQDGARLGALLRFEGSEDVMTPEPEAEPAPRSGARPPPAPSRTEILDLLFGDGAQGPLAARAPGAPGPALPGADPDPFTSAPALSPAPDARTPAPPLVLHPESLPFVLDLARRPRGAGGSGARPDDERRPIAPFVRAETEGSVVQGLELPRPSLGARVARCRGRLIAGAVAVALAASVALLVGQRRAATRESAFVAAISATDDRLGAGRLAAPAGDSALDHLEVARRLCPDDPRLTSRGTLLADALEAFGRNALARGDLQEAAAHFKGALRAEPTRASAQAQLETIMRIAPLKGGRRP